MASHSKLTYCTCVGGARHDISEVVESLHPLQQHSLIFMAGTVRSIVGGLPLEWTNGQPGTVKKAAVDALWPQAVSPMHVRSGLNLFRPG